MAIFNIEIPMVKKLKKHSKHVLSTSSGPPFKARGILVYLTKMVNLIFNYFSYGISFVTISKAIKKHYSCFSFVKKYFTLVTIDPTN